MIIVNLCIGSHVKRKFIVRASDCDLAMDSVELALRDAGEWSDRYELHCAGELEFERFGMCPLTEV